MKSLLATSFLAVFFLSLAGCPAPPSDAISGAEQSAIEEYQAREAAEQAALAGEMEAGLDPKAAKK
ncbi:hypothetical protein Enr13x_69450 [Stieleria neptunia]|uniref:Secreted protein n=1 Tax=Stieleria neptunia TaxID=2527979 RepID=A0A518I1V0_9BACT|nr:hypothetical protein [Stieleria neptunia]QDV47036.1 hypothetical protein Enr13x_69450 [Stieleria neptunia]